MWLDYPRNWLARILVETLVENNVNMMMDQNVGKSLWHHTLEIPQWLPWRKIFVLQLLLHLWIHWDERSTLKEKKHAQKISAPNWHFSIFFNMSWQVMCQSSNIQHFQLRLKPTGLKPWKIVFTILEQETPHNIKEIHGLLGVIIMYWLMYSNLLYFLLICS